MPELPLPTLSAERLSCERGERPLFADLDFALAAGDVVWLRGRNGRGKTSLMRTVAGLSAPAAGRLLWGGTALARAEQGWRERLVHLGHANALKEDLTVQENLDFLTRLLGLVPDTAQLRRGLAAVGMGLLAARPVRTLSQGQRRRVALARLALAPRPSLWLLDEPFDALDTDGIERLAGLIAAHANAGGAVLFTSHQAVPSLTPQPRELDLDACSVPR